MQFRPTRLDSGMACSCHFLLCKSSVELPVRFRCRYQANGGITLYLCCRQSWHLPGWHLLSRLLPWLLVGLQSRRQLLCHLQSWHLQGAGNSFIVECYGCSPGVAHLIPHLTRQSLSRSRKYTKSASTSTNFVVGSLATTVVELYVTRTST
jgi:hypothetical protein